MNWKWLFPVWSWSSEMVLGHGPLYQRTFLLVQWRQAEHCDGKERGSLCRARALTLMLILVGRLISVPGLRTLVGGECSHHCIIPAPTEFNFRQRKLPIVQKLVKRILNNSNYMQFPCFAVLQNSTADNSNLSYIYFIKHP